jgi:hypothetical protein
MGDHVEQLFSMAVARKDTVPKPGSFHRKILLLDADRSIAQEGGRINNKWEIVRGNRVLQQLSRKKCCKIRVFQTDNMLW